MNSTLPILISIDQQINSVITRFTDEIKLIKINFYSFFVYKIQRNIEIDSIEMSKKEKNV